MQDVLQVAKNITSRTSGEVVQSPKLQSENSSQSEIQSLELGFRG